MRTAPIFIVTPCRASSSKANCSAASKVEYFYKAADGEIACIRDLKFRCPKGVKTTKQDTEQLKKYRRILGKAAEIIQPR